MRDLTVSHMFRSLLAALLLCAGLAAPSPAAPPPQPADRAGSGSTRFDTLIADAKASMLSDPQQTLALAKTAAALAQTDPAIRDDVTAEATAYWLAGEALIRLNEIDRAKPFIHRAWLAVGSQNKASKLKGDILLSRGGIDSAVPDVAGALSAYHKAHRVFRDIGDTRSQAIALLSIASLYREANDNTTALRYYDQALDAYRADPSLLLAIYNNRANALKAIGRLDDAETQFEAALALAEKMDSVSQQSRILRNVARTQILMGRLDDAERTIARGLALRTEDDATARAQFLGISATLAQRRGNIAKARRLIDEALSDVDIDTSTLAYRDLHETAYQIYKQTGDEALALEHLEALKRLDDQTAKLAASTNTALMAARFDYANQNLKIAQLKAEELRRSVRYERERARFQRIVFVGAGVAALIVVALLVFGILAIRRSRNQVRAANVGLAETNTALAKALAAKTEFLATTSHEIRTPLNGILGMTQVMLADARLPSDTRDRIEIVHGAGVTMRALVDDILDVAKIETGNLTIEHAEMDVCAVLTDVARMWEEQARAKGVDFVLSLDDCPALVMGDAARLRQVVFNLLANALKFTPAGRIALSAHAVEEAGHPRVRISISDTGIGIAADKLDAIFESFRQADTSTTRRFGGTGLGLAICRNLARAMDGDVRVESVEGEGSTFTIDLPLIEAQPREDEHAERADRGLLIVERNPITRSMLRALLEPCTPWIEVAGSLADARAALARGQIALAIVDDGAIDEGVDLAEAMMDFSKTAVSYRTKTVLLWHASTTARAAVAASGVDLMIDKPIAGAELRARLFPRSGLSETGFREDTLVSDAA
jgi:signal transduction histidine kinase/CheY-like chemotaxis protein